MVDVIGGAVRGQLRQFSPLGAQSTFLLLHHWGSGGKVLLRYFLTEKVTKRLFLLEVCDKMKKDVKGAILWE